MQLHPTFELCMTLPVFQVEAFGQSDVGLVRSKNQDGCLIADLTEQCESGDGLNHRVGPKGILFIVADGVGGGINGEDASLLTLKALASYLEQVRQPSDNQEFRVNLDLAIQQAHRDVQHFARTHSIMRIGTTVTAAVIWQNSLITAQVGDSRAYIFRNHDLVQITQDQSLVQELVRSGQISPAEAQVHPQRNVILQAVGQKEKIRVVFTEHTLQDGDRILICSDGLYGMLEHSEIEELLAQDLPAAAIAAQLIKRSNDQGGRDNITALVVKLKKLD
jgi:protein phosphatase